MNGQPPRRRPIRSRFTWQVTLDLAPTADRVAYWQAEGAIPAGAELGRDTQGRTVITWTNVADSRPEAETDMHAAFKALPTPLTRKLVRRDPTDTTTTADTPQDPGILPP